MILERELVLNAIVDTKWTKESVYCLLWVDNNYKNYHVECYQGFLGLNGKCAIKNPVCKDIDQSNACTSCWPGYVLDSSTCVPEKAGATGGDIYCIKAGYIGHVLFRFLLQFYSLSLHRTWSLM